MRSEYAKRTKEKLWVNKVDMVENIERNLIEYAYERYNPVTVCEENDMYLCTVTNGESLCVSTLTYMPQTLPHNNLNCLQTSSIRSTLMSIRAMLSLSHQTPLMCHHFDQSIVLRTILLLLKSCTKKMYIKHVKLVRVKPPKVSDI